MLKNRDIVVVGLASLDSSIGSNVINLAKEFAKDNRVLYVNYPIDRFTLWRQKDSPVVQDRIRRKKEHQPELIKLEENFWSLYPDTLLESISQLPINWLFDHVNLINNKRQARCVNKALKQLDFKDVIIFNDTDMFRSFHLKELIGASTLAYYTRDNMIAVDFWKTQGIRIEAALMAKADLVVANSTYLAQLASKFNPRSFYVGQGCDVSLFNPALIDGPPDDMKSVLERTKPLIGYIGVLYALRLDIEVLIHIAKSRPDWDLVLVGPEDEAFESSELHNLPNVFFLGSKKMEELPAYLKYMDVALNPQKLNPVTIGNYPRKIDEYLAMGKPTVATKTVAMEVFADYTYLADTKEDYVELIDKALAENSPELETKRSKLAHSHTWEANAKEIYRRIIEVERSEHGTSK